MAIEIRNDLKRSPVQRDRRLKVLQIGKFYSPYRGGIETHLKELCEGLTQHADVDVLVANTAMRTVREVVDSIPVTRLRTFVHVAGASFCPDMVNQIRNSDADIIHIHLPNPTAILAYIASRHPGKLVCSYHSDVVRQKVLGAMFEPVLRATLRRSDAILYACPNVLRNSPTLQAFKSRCHLVSYGLPQAPKPSADSITAARKRLGDRIVLGVGRLVYYKGFENIIRAMQHIDGRLCLVGVGPLRKTLGDLADSLGLTDRVVFTGETSIEDLQALYHAADVFVLPSIARSEAFGIVQIEAMAAGTPVVNTNLDSGVPFVSLHQVTGLTVPPKDVSALVVAVNSLLNDPELRARLGAAARLRAESEFSLEAMISRVVGIYESVMSESALGARSIAVSA